MIHVTRQDPAIPTVPISDCAVTRREDVIRRMLAHHGEQARQAAARQAPVPAPGYQPGTLEILFGAGTP
jgi:hypothetical protein